MNVLFAARNKYRPRRRSGIARNKLLELLFPGLCALFGDVLVHEEHQRLFKEECDANNT